MEGSPNISTADTCESILEDADLGIDAFYSWNPSVHHNCTGLQSSVSYCIMGEGYEDTYYSSATPTHTSTATPTPSSTCPPGGVEAPGSTQSGVPCTCKKYQKYQTGKYCQDMADDNDITLKEFLAWNPAVGDGCKNLWPDYYYCVGVSD
ncbi:unnamed protein product [Penicillium pancosmium]